MKKSKIILVIVLIFVTIAAIYLFTNRKSNQAPEQMVLEDTLSISKEYAALHRQTENVLLKVMEYGDYDTWIKEMDLVVEDWKNFEKKAADLENSANQLTNQEVTFKLINSAQAYDSVEIQKVIENAPAGRQIRTLAKHLGVDAKMAQLILNQTQDQITREAYGMEGDVYETCEQNSMRIKNGAKVTVFVGGVVLTGGMAGVAASGVVAKTALVVGGADLVLEVADDEAKIALGDKNKVSEMVGKVRTVTEPAASILTIASMPGNLSKAMEKISAISFAGDQIRSVAQDEKILGISIKTDEKGEAKAQVSAITEDELEEWKQKNNIVASKESIEEILQTKEIESANNSDDSLKEEANNEEENNNIGGFGFKGTLVNVSGGNMAEQSTDLDFNLNTDGTVSGDNFKNWKQEGNIIKLFGEDEAAGYYQFTVSGDSLTLSKMVIGGEEIEPGQEFMGGFAPAGVLYKKNESNNESPKGGIISYSDWDDWGDADSRYKDDLIEKFGSPDVTGSKGGKELWVYYDIVYNSSGRTCSPMYTFYDTGQTATRKCETRENIESILQNN